MSQMPPQRPHQQHPNYAMYPPQGHPQAAPPGPPPRKPKKPIYKRVWFWLIVAVVGIFALSQAAGGGGGNQSADGGAQPAGQATRAGRTTPPPPGMNTPVKDDSLEFSVTGFRCGVQVEDPLAKVQPQGQFCKMDLSVKNVGTKQEMLMDDNVKVLDDKGAEYGPGSETFIVKGVIVLKQINPGNTLTGSIYYDVPTGVTPTRAKVQGSMFSKGAVLELK